MTSRWLLLAHVWSVTIRAVAGCLELLQLSFNRYRFWICRLLAVPMTRRAGVNGNIRRQATQRIRACDVDVAGSAFRHVFAFAALMGEFGRDSFRRIHRDKLFRQLVTATTVAAQRFLKLPVTIKASVVTARQRLEWIEQRWVRRCRRQVRDRQVLVRLMTDGAVVVIRLLVNGWHRLQSVMRFKPHRLKSVPLSAAGNHILVLVMRELDRELAFVFCFRCLV